MTELKHRQAWSFAAWTWLLAVIFFSLGPSVPQPDALPVDKFYHAFSYLALQWLFGSLHRGTVRRILLATAFVALGIGLELLQGMTSYRLADPWDAAANTLGVVTGLLLLRLVTVEVFERRWRNLRA